MRWAHATAVCLALGASPTAISGLAPSDLLSARREALSEVRERAQQLRDARTAELAHALLAQALVRPGSTSPEPPDERAQALLDLADLDLDLWRTADASARVQEASLLEQDGDAGSPASIETTIRLLEVRARISRVRGDYAEARQLWDQALAARRRQPPADPRPLLEALAATAEAHWFTGDLSEASALFDQALAIAEDLPVSDEYLIGRALKDVGLLAETRGQLQAAESLYRRSLELIRHARGDSHPAVAPRWISVGNLAVVREDLLTADAAYEQAAAILEPLTDRSLASEKATLALNRGALDARLGRVDSAREHLERARLLWTETRGPDHPHLAWVSESLAEVLADAGRFEEAGEAQADAQARRQRTAPGSPLTVLTTARLGALRAREGKTTEARALLRSVDADAGRLVDAGTFFFANLSARRAEAFEALGELATASRLRAEVEMLLARQLPAGHPGLADARAQRARVAWRAGRPRQALRWALDAWTAQRRLVSDTVHALPEGDALRYLERSREMRDLVLCAASGGGAGVLSPAGADEVGRELAASRALVSGALQAGAPTGRTNDDELRTAQRRYAALLWQPVWSAPKDYADELLRARRALEELERREARGSAAGESGAPVPGAWAGLGPGDALISFGRYRCPVKVGTTADAGGYVAFVRRSGGVPRTVRFPDAAALERTIDDWYAAVTAAVHAPPTEAQDEEMDLRGRALTKALWAPLAAAIGSAARVFIVPDGKLHSVSWHALPTAPGSYLIDGPRVLHVLTAESDLRRSDGPSAARAVVVMADPQLERSSQVADAGALRSSCRFVDPRRLPRLGEAQAEAREVEQQATAAGRPVIAATGGDASERWLREHAPRAGILHLAAHGGVLSPESCREPASSTDEPASARVRSLWAEAVRARPLMRSGLLLTGAAGFTPLDAPGTDDDGVLVAEEAARLDLRGADWVVLSACSTRRGPVVDAEGALGLHRAFHSAGARTVIASLWDVQDAPARRFMTALYDARLREQRTTAEAMRDAQRAVLNELRANGRSTHPVQWAAFVASGDWR